MVMVVTAEVITTRPDFGVQDHAAGHPYSCAFQPVNRRKDRTMPS